VCPVNHTFDLIDFIRPFPLREEDQAVGHPSLDLNLPEVREMSVNPYCARIHMEAL
jgi:hypothetical protein